ncbi:MAG: acyl-CoA dehydrogenase family protein, partial [Chloroflexota bacterium]
MDFNPTEVELMIRETARQFAIEHVEPRAKEIDEKDEFFPDLVEIAGDLGLLGMELPESEGGAGCGTLAAVMSGEEIGRVSAAVCNVVGAIRLHVNLLSKFGTPAQKERWLEVLCSGR